MLRRSIKISAALIASDGEMLLGETTYEITGADATTLIESAVGDWAVSSNDVGFSSLFCFHFTFE